MYQLIGFIAFIASLTVSFILKSKFKKFSKEDLKVNFSGKEIAEKMLSDNFIHDVKIICVDGELSDHYNPINKTINLSHDVYHGRNIASAAVSAHETGHAVQHAKSYLFLKMRSILVPVVSFSSRFLSIIIFIGFLTIKKFPIFLEIGILMFAFTTLFSLITLPVEFDASNRALDWIKANKIATKEEYPKAKEALSWAALTYIIAAIGSIAQLMHLLSIRDREE
jgi:Zn-dependent membrane protease YugP